MYRFQWRKKIIKVKSWFGKTIFPSLLHYTQIEMRFLFNEIIHKVTEKNEATTSKSMTFFPDGWFVKELNENGLGGFFTSDVVTAYFLSNRTINQQAFRFSDKIG